MDDPEDILDRLGIPLSMDCTEKCLLILVDTGELTRLALIEGSRAML